MCCARITRPDGSPIVAGGRVEEETPTPDAVEARAAEHPEYSRACGDPHDRGPTRHLMAWLEGTALATWTRESGSIWAYPTILTLHTVGLGIVVGASAVVDFRLLGFAPRIPLPSLTSAVPIHLVGVRAQRRDRRRAVHGRRHRQVAPAGVLRQAGADRARARGTPRWCGGTVFAARRRPAIAGTPARAAARLAAASLCLWTGAIVAGRLMAYL